MGRARHLSEQMEEYCLRTLTIIHSLYIFTQWPGQWRSKSAPDPYAKQFLRAPPNDMGSNSVNLLIFMTYITLRDYSQAILITV